MIILFNQIFAHSNTFLSTVLNRKLITLIVLSIQLISVVITSIIYIYSKNNGMMEIKYNWLILETHGIGLSFIIDAFTIIFMILISGITLIVMCYSISYLGHDPFLGKFLGLLGIFCFSMIWLCIANNLVTLFVGWELVGLISFGLISFWNSRNEAISASLKAVFVNRIGDIFLLLGIILIMIQNKSSEISLMNIFSESEMLKGVSILFCLAAAAKSAQIFLHIWLPDAMEGPTPVSSLLHSATMVTAGVILIIKCNTFIGFDYKITYIFAILGLFSAIIAAIFGIFQYDIKKIIAYSTCSQLGLLYLSAVLGNLFAASYHLLTHAFFKCLLFLCSGVIIHANDNEQDIRKMGRLYKILPLVYFIFNIGTLSLIGFIFMSGYYSKEFLLESFFNSGVFGNFLFIFATVGVFFSAFYSARVLYLTFIKPHISFNKNSLFLDGDNFMYLSLLILTMFSIGIGHWGIFSFTNYFWNDCLQINHNSTLLEYELFSSFFFQHFPLIFSLLGFSLGITLFSSSKYSYLSNFNFFYSFSCSIILKNYFDLLYAYFFSRLIFIVGFIKYLLIDRGFLEVSHFIFINLSKNKFQVIITFFILSLSIFLVFFYIRIDVFNTIFLANLGFVVHMGQVGSKITKMPSKISGNAHRNIPRPPIIPQNDVPEKNSEALLKNLIIHRL